MRERDAVPADPRGYILAITERIWEAREVGALAQWYADDIVVRSPTGLVRGNVPVIASTLATLAEFPDRRLPGEDVIWIGDSANGFLSSHRLVCTMTKTRDGAYGRASGQRVHYRIIADCFVRDGQVCEEWLARDQGAIARCLGDTPEDLAARQIGAGDRVFYVPDADVASAHEPVIERSGPAAHHAETWRSIVEMRDLRVILEAYQRAAALEGPGGERHVGHDGIARFFTELIAAFPDARLRIEHAFAREEPERPVRVALRLSIDAIHGGHGRFGSPTGAPVHIMALVHAEVVANQVRAEWVVFDEVAIWKQVLLHGGHGDTPRPRDADEA